MRSFYEQQNKIENYLKENYPKFLEEYNIKAPEVTTDFLDLDRFKGDFTLFLEYSNVQFPAMSTTQWSDDCEPTIRLQLRIYLVFRNNTPKNLKENVLNASFAFYKMYRNNHRFSVSEETTINGLDFYNYVEGTKYIVASEINLTMEIAI